MLPRSTCLASSANPAASPLERNGIRPTLDICGMWSGFSGEGSKTIIPASAHAKVSCRLSAGMHPGRTFEANARRHPRRQTCRASPSRSHGSTTWSRSWSAPSTLRPQTAMACLRDVFGKEPYSRLRGRLHRCRGQFRQGPGKRRSCSWGSPIPTTRRIRPTNCWCWPTTRAASGPSRAIGKRSRATSTDGVAGHRNDGSALTALDVASIGSVEACHMEPVRSRPRLSSL